MERTFTARTQLDAILLEQALAMARELESAYDAAPDGQVLAIAEEVAVRSGRKLTLAALEAALRRLAEAAEKNGASAGPAPAAAGVGPRIRRPAGRDLGRPPGRPQLEAVRTLRADGLPGRRPHRDR